MSSIALIAGDNDLVRTMLRAALEAQGYQVFETRTGQECLQQYEQLHPNLIFLDCAMPEMDSYACCEAIREKTSAEHTPIVMIASRNDIVSIKRAFDSGATDYIFNPIQ
jgi:diguanylate cyclase